jgi:hypothetical protein
MEEHAMAHDARHGSDHNGYGAVDRDRLRVEMHHLEISLQRVIDLLHRELALTLGLEPS